MRPGDHAWIALFVGVAMYELAAALDDGGELLSEACDRYRQAHPIITHGAIIYVAGHLARVWPRCCDPLCILADTAQRWAR